MPHHPAADRADLERCAARLVERLGGRWRPGGAMCRCPAHDDRHPSLSIRLGERGLLLKCFAGCAAADVIRAIRAAGMPWRPSAREACGLRVDDSPRRQNAALRLWGRARPAEGTPAGHYLESRGLDPPHPEARYLARTPLGDGASLRFLPALLVAVRDESGIVAVQRTFLESSGARTTKLRRRSLGPLGAGAVRLAAPGSRLGLAEGYETARAAMRQLGLPVWATLGAGRLDRIALPPAVATVVLLADPDPAGESAVVRAAAAYAAQGRRVEVCWPPAGRSDWAD